MMAGMGRRQNAVAGTPGVPKSLLVQFWSKRGGLLDVCSSFYVSTSNRVGADGRGVVWAFVSLFRTLGSDAQTARVKVRCSASCEGGGDGSGIRLPRCEPSCLATQFERKRRDIFGAVEPGE